MPLRNRVTPDGRIVAHSARGLLMGNRGCLHDEAGRIVRMSARDAWISCIIEPDGPPRRLLQPGCYTELFFLDEATALAAGHRPCGSCRPDALAAFKAAWRFAHRLNALPLVCEIDIELRNAGVASARASRGSVLAADMPDGVIVWVGELAALRWRGHWRRWSFGGYCETIEVGREVIPITSRPMSAVLRAGYAPMLHASALGDVLSAHPCAEARSGAIMHRPTAGGVLLV